MQRNRKDQSDELSEFEEDESEKESDPVQELLSNLKRNQSTSSHRHIKIFVPNPQALSIGFRLSTLGQNLKDGVGVTSNHLIPELNSNGLSFKDLHLENQTQVRSLKETNPVCGLIN